jgi:hypothetical protein
MDRNASRGSADTCRVVKGLAIRQFSGQTQVHTPDTISKDQGMRRNRTYHGLLKVHERGDHGGENDIDAEVHEVTRCCNDPEALPRTVDQAPHTAPQALPLHSLQCTK